MRGNLLSSQGHFIEAPSALATAMLPPNGRFEFLGLAVGNYSVFASVNGYTLSKVPGPRADGSVETTTYAPGVAPPFLIDHDVDDFVITLHPE